ncbi:MULTISPECIES: hypothetical protein [unclassified Clostridioides]|uniref:hypothetical protein n=1 Tax=unclassified Clostridioides TaxID=2635829 RepID=UPI001D10DC84|nr:hypothetical protein [Clostridioides sp. ES-S-0001-02]MCC0638967.1 hypothetical protein [Clostridioides sp. ES-S-0049-03]MCC0657306.1 hypothetical protein [Clostridioides sp. ES-S-0123-01]MCC0675357.1 hypothetical protein [Clostridioides sp. ES-W-0018-02]MCC0709834.1 hypothetical protein [Clostridioides sp. ES-W-0017-02]
MAVIGEQLLQPESGWKRYDEANIQAIIKGTFWGKENFNGFYGGSSIWLKSIDSSYKFKFYGNKLRLISDRNTNRPQNNTKLVIDGVEYICNTYGQTNGQILAIDVGNLEDSIHDVVISPVKEGLATIDCIDINSDGYILDLALERNKTINKLEVGEYIPCNYSYYDGFSSFYTGKDINFICVSHTDRQSILICDKVIPDLSFDEINQKGFIYGNELENQSYEHNILKIQSLTGGSNNNGLSEYDKYIVNSDLNGLITPGDKTIWNWDICSITSSISASDNSKIITRGYSSLTNYSTNNTFNNKGPTFGFRPVLIIKHLYVSPSFEINQFGNFDNCFSIANINLDISIKIPKVSVSIINTTNSKTFISTELINVVDNYLNIDYTFNKDDFELNKVNVLKITLTDENEFETSIEINTFPIEDKLLIFNNSITSTIIENKHNKDRMIVCANIKDNCIVLYLNNNNYIEANLEDYVSVNKNTKLKFLLDKNSDLISYGLSFI